MEVQSMPNPQLCQRCASVRDSIERSRTGPTKHIPLGRIAQYPRGLCVLCDYFLDMLPPEAREGDEAFYSYSCHLQSIQEVRETSKLLGGFLPAPGGMVLQLDPIPRAMKTAVDGPGLPLTFVRDAGDRPFRPLGDQIDFEIPKHWLSLCSKLHSRLDCGKTLADGPSRLIDCNTRCIMDCTGTVEAPPLDYVALSYLWGSEPVGLQRRGLQDYRATSKLTNDMPKTIEDAITVTKRLGYDYLWVDKYCIDQCKTQDRDGEIQRMDAIYRNADVTIIDAAGEDPYGGLPGVRPKSRSPHQPSVRLGTFELLSAMRRPDWDIKNSRWRTRGWTYQEGLLSKRRLVFTSQQLYFQCQSAFCKEVLHCSESISVDTECQWLENIPVSMMDLHELERANEHCDERMNMFTLNFIIERPFEGILCFLEEYSRRILTKDDDILNGILGLFRHTERLSRPILNVWGLPLLHAEVPVSPSSCVTADISLFFYTLFWNIKRPSARRKGFPSWSWSGWYSEVEWITPWASEGKVELEAADGKRISLDKFASMQCSLRPVLHVTTYTAAAFRENPRNDPDVFSPRFKFDNISKSITFSATTTDFLDDGDQYLALIGRGLYSMLDSDGVLIARKTGAVWERVACVKAVPFSDTGYSRTKYIWKTVTLG